MEENKIKDEAKQIMDNFIDALKDIEVEENFTLIRDECLRVEGKGDELDEDFKNRFLANAPKTSGSAILANKGAWEK